LKILKKLKTASLNSTFTDVTTDNASVLYLPCLSFQKQPRLAISLFKLLAWWRKLTTAWRKENSFLAQTIVAIAQKMISIHTISSRLHRIYACIATLCKILKECVTSYVIF